MPLIVRVLQHEFAIQREYSAGHKLTASEAAAMNQLLVENVRNNVYGWVTREARGRGVLTADQQADLTARITDYAEKYQFKTRVRTKITNILEVTVREVAMQHAEVWGNQNGFGPDSKEVYAKYIDLKSDSRMYAEARNLIEQRQSVMSNALEGLL